MNNKIVLIIIPVVAYLVYAALPSSSKLIGGDQFFVSEDMGKTWEQQTVRDTGFALTSLNFLSIAIDPEDSGIVYLGTRDNGLYKSCCRGKRWYKIEDKNNVLSGRANVYDVAIDTTNPERVYAATYQDKRGRLFRSQDGGDSWEEIYITSEERYAIFSVLIDVANPAIIYIGTAQGGLIKSVDYGTSWQIVNWFDDTISDIAMHPSNNRVMYVSTFQRGVYRTTDGGQRWTSLEENMKEFAQADHIDKMAIDSQNPNIIYTVSEYGIMNSVNGGATWQEVNMVAPANTVPALGLAVDAGHANHLFYGAGSILYSSLDKGKNWVVDKLPNNLQIKVIAVDPKNPNLIYLGMHK